MKTQRRRRVAISFTLDDDIHRILKNASRNNDMSFSAAIRRLIGSMTPSEIYAVTAPRRREGKPQILVAAAFDPEFCIALEDAATKRGISRSAALARVVNFKIKSAARRP